MPEIWRPVIGYETHYEVSSRGRVRRVLGGRGATAGRILVRYEQNSDGYRAVQLSRNDRKRTIGVHVLVAEAFLGPRPRGKFPNHKNLRKSDNRADNLEWLTRKQNARHAIANGAIGGRVRGTWRSVHFSTGSSNGGSDLVAIVAPGVNAAHADFFA